jgi:hypothetical protein
MEVDEDMDEEEPLATASPKAKRTAKPTKPVPTPARSASTFIAKPG